MPHIRYTVTFTKDYDLDMATYESIKEDGTKPTLEECIEFDKKEIRTDPFEFLETLEPGAIKIEHEILKP